MKLKRLFPIIILGLACLLAATAAADSDTVMPGDTVTVDLVVDTEDAAFVQIAYEIDENVYEFVSGQSDVGAVFEKGFAGVRLDKPISGSVATLTLRVKEKAKDGKYPLKASVQSAYTADETKASAKAQLGSFTVKGKEGIKVELPDGVFRISADKTAEYLSPVNKNVKKVNIPEKITINGQNYAVTSIKANAFKGLKKLVSVSIGNAVESIGKYAFTACKNLKTVSGGEQVTTIGECAFKGCTSLTEFAIGNHVTALSENIFSGCTKLAKVTGGAGLKTIGASAFRGCSALTAFEIGSKVTSIGKYAFFNCKNLAKVSGGKALTAIGNSAFQKCTSLKEFTLESEVKTIGNFAFQNCKKLKKITVKTKKLKDKKDVGNKAFNSIASGAVISCPKGYAAAYEELFTNAGASSTVKFK